MTAPAPLIALVTGASRGFGFATARALGARGVHVVALARTVGGLEDLADAIEADGGPSPTLVPLSITDEGGLRRLCLAVHERWGRLDLAIHAAAIAPPLSPAANTAEKDFDQALETNLRATQRLIPMLAPLLLAAPSGRFVYVGDDRTGQAFFGAYAAAKAGAEALVRAWAAETARIGPMVEIFQPRPMPTALRARFYPGENARALTPCATEATRLVDALMAEVTAV
ncbi:MAG: SDR family NAD(P)-dependent oxidoreductase [Amaricoccus sp.]|uniref:SDR family NAD(P)-dependent oxidoreductase n=1 Tax=Amaricoccus sp. TaxID=1872485 RepID=UPI003314F977